MKKPFTHYFPLLLWIVSAAFFLAAYFMETSYCLAENIAVIVNQANPLNNLSVSQLARIYKGQQQYWPDGKPIVLVNRPADSNIRKTFYKEVLDSKPTQKFFIPGSPVPLKTIVQESTLATIRFVSNMPEAIGYVYSRKLDKTNKDIKKIWVIETDDQLIQPDEEPDK